MKYQTERPEGELAERVFAPDGWGYDWKGKLVDLNCMRPGEDGIPSVFVSKLAKDATP